MNLPNIAISGGTLSDIFFNHEHPNLDAAQAPAKGEGLSLDEYREALTKDAAEFASILNGQATADDLVEDFMARL